MTGQNRPTQNRPGHVGPVHIGQIACWQGVAAGLIAAIGRDPLVLLGAGLLATAVLAVTAVRVDGRWAYEWIGLAGRYSYRRRRWPATPDPAHGRSLDLANGRTAGTATGAGSGAEPGILAAVSPGARIGELDLDTSIAIGVVTHEAGLTAVLEVESTVDGSVTLPSPLALLPMAEAGESPITAQALIEVVPAPVDTTLGTDVEQSYRSLHPTPPPARRHGWIALQATRTADGAGTGGQELGTVLTSAIRRTRRRLEKAGFTTRVLDRDELADTLDELGADRPDPTNGAPPSGAMAEEWAHWRTPTCAQTTLAVVNWPDPSIGSAAFERLADAAGVPTVLALGIRRADQGVDVQAALRLTSATRHDVDRAVHEVRACAAATGLRLRRLDGEQAHGVAATLPLGGFLR
ncbi:type VII secretion protein EccE [Cryptosporangium aurantiacum]|uniref:Type VII secretion protein EccE n=1 Tax=Cryptosporangium aurantiacum TaxID=134849 RepID=A0A1M7NIH1_9ACTN|nr:type VII secretion protein EccE [Cryptosporangium aurantiacum]SHN03482.1 type VII secretion protein EccE [Cryptosporangium aurantiacum]